MDIDNHSTIRLKKNIDDIRTLVTPQWQKRIDNPRIPMYNKLQ